MIYKIVIFFLIFIACEDISREWDNPYDPRSNRSLWTPDSLRVDPSIEGQIKLTWQRKGRDFDGFIINRKIGDGDWVDSVATLWDSTFTWTDTLEMKSVVQNKYIYSYQLYAYADTNRSNIVSAQISPLVPNPPGSVTVLSIVYINKPPKTLEVSWSKSTETAFKQYIIYHAESRDGSFDLYETISDINRTVLDTTIFTVLKENWFKVGVIDTTGQETISESNGIPVDPPPAAVKLDSITFANNSFALNWTRPTMTDFSHYTVEGIQIEDTSIIWEEWVTLIDSSFKSLAVPKDQEQHIRIKLSDIWGNHVRSNIRPGSSYQKVVKVDYIRVSGDDITIQNLGPSLPFKHILPQVNAQFPVWIQNGKKIFALSDKKMGLVVNEDGTGLRVISGEIPYNVSFNPDQTLAVYVGVDHNIYLAYLDKDQNPIRITNTANNEWYSDPVFIDNGNKILYAQRKHQANNNVGVKDIYSMDLDGLNVVKITDAPNLDKFILPSLNPAEDKLLYVKEEDGLYVLNYPNESIGTAVTKRGDEKVIPESSQYFRNIRWSPDGSKAVLWSNENGSYFLYVYDPKAKPPLYLLQSGGRYGNWISNDTILFRFENADAMYKKVITADSGDEPILFYDAPWAQLQPRQ